MVTFSRISQATHQGVKGGVVVDGLDALVQSFTREAAEARQRAEKVVVDNAARMADRMRKNVPLGPPALHVRDSITSDHTATGTGRGVYADAGADPRADAGAFVGRFLEHGTVKMSPRPWAGPAADETLPEFLRDIKGLPKL